MEIKLSSGSPMLSSGFIFGAATASFQIEGRADQRLPCIWDTFCAQPGKIADGSDGREACDHIARLEEDLDLLKFLGVDAYRFSISWPRAVTLDGSLNPEGIDFYERLVDGLLERGIKPFATLYHWDLPQYLEDNGGWLNRETAFAFRDYADKVTRVLGDRVHSWATLNEPFCSAFLGYEAGVHAPGKRSKQKAKTAAHHLLLAHGLGMQVLETNCPNALNGIVLNFTPGYPASSEEADHLAVQAADAEMNRWYLEPLLLGTYPEVRNGSSSPAKPPIEAGDMEIISRPLDFLGVNYYTRGIFRSSDNRAFEQLPPPFPQTDMGWEIFPSGLTDLLVSLNERYSLPDVYITENGAAMPDLLANGKVNDAQRIEYLQTHLEAVENAMEQGVNIKGYFCWSLLDNFEWAFGYTKRFGLVHVDFESQQRTIKESGKAFRSLLVNRATG